MAEAFVTATDVAAVEFVEKVAAVFVSSRPSFEAEVVVVVVMVPVSGGGGGGGGGATVGQVPASPKTLARLTAVDPSAEKKRWQ